MEEIKQITDLITATIPEDCFGLLVEIDFYTREIGFRIQGDGLDSSGCFVKYMNYGDLSDFISTAIHSWNFKTINTPGRWNKSRFVVYKDGRTEVKTWWDQEFQRSLYLDAE